MLMHCHGCIMEDMEDPDELDLQMAGFHIHGCVMYIAMTI